MPNLSTTDAQQASILRRRQLAQALQQMSLEPIQSPPIPGARISPWQGIAKLAQALSGNLENRNLDKEQTALSANTDQQKLAQALSLSNTVVPPAHGDVIQPDNNGLPIPQVGPGPQQLNPAPQQLDAREAAKQSLAKALSSSDPVMQRAGEVLMQMMLTGSQQDKQRAFEAAQNLGNQAFTTGLQAQTQAGENQRLDKTLAQQLAIQNLPARPKESQLLTPEEEAQQLRLHPPPVKEPPKIDPYSDAGIAAQIKIRQAEAKLRPDSDLSPEQLDSLVAAAKINPDSLKKLSPKDYASVAARLQQQGGTAPDKMQVMKETMRDNALDTAKWLQNNFEPSAVGVKGLTSGFGLMAKPAPGTKARDFTDKFDTFKNQIVLPNLDMLKGLGRVTDREFQALTSSINAIDRSMTEGQFKEELGKIITTFENMKGAVPDATTSSPNVIRYDAQGNRIK